jgi:hypothetical protein
MLTIVRVMSLAVALALRVGPLARASGLPPPQTSQHNRSYTTLRDPTSRLYGTEVCFRVDRHDEAVHSTFGWIRPKRLKNCLGRQSIFSDQKDVIRIETRFATIECAGVA